MTVLNQLIAKAKCKPKPKELTINANHLGTLVDNYIALTHTLQNNERTQKLIRDMILNGQMSLMGVPVRVIGGSIDESLAIC